MTQAEFVHADTLAVAARLDLPPDPAARLHLPDSFGTRFALFGDAEEEFDWNGPFRRDATATVSMAALPAANARFQLAGVQPCWLADYPIVDSPDSAAILRGLVADGLCTVGTQLHPWVCPPFDEEVNTRNSYTGNLPLDLQRAKLAAMTTKIEAAVGVRPTVYRAGRYGIGRHTAALLAEYGYALDVSVRASFDYRSQGGPNFRNHPQWPWKLADGLYELPLSTAFTGPLGRWPALHLAESLRGTLARTGLFARVPLTPEGVPLTDALEAIEALLGEGRQVFSLSFHTPSLVPGYTPYVRDAGELATFWRWWDGVFDRFAARGITPIGANGIIAALKQAEAPAAPTPYRMATATRPVRPSDIVPLHAFLANPDPDWDAIAARPSEPNSFAESWFVEASARHLKLPESTRMLAVREEGQLIGLMPIHVAPTYGRIPVRHVENWMHFNCFFGAPLIRRSFEPFFWQRALALLDDDAGAPAFLHMTALEDGGPIATALLAARSGAAVVHRSRRALLASDLTPAAYYETTVRKKKRKEIGRLQSRLNELGTVTCRRLTDAGELDGWVDAFLSLEASGWKGRNGAALANDGTTAAFMRDAMHGAFAAGRLEVIRLDLDDRAIAMLVNFLSPPGSFSFKIAFDEDYARFSPGVLIQLENLKILGAPGIDWMDSCAVEGHPMIESLWGERRQVVRISVPLKSIGRRATFAACRALETASATVRKIA